MSHGRLSTFPNFENIFYFLKIFFRAFQALFLHQARAPRPSSKEPTAADAWICKALRKQMQAKAHQSSFVIQTD
jgi:hypothetical protein